jgi:uncharacterized membrane protein YGL010W
MKSFADLSRDYKDAHQNPINRRLHALGITSIILGTFAMGGQFFGLIIWAAAGLFGITQSRVLGTLFAAATLCLWALSKHLGWISGITLFGVGWYFQLVGHSQYEKNRPAFLSALAQLIVGPMVLLGEALGIHSDGSEIKDS